MISTSDLFNQTASQLLREGKTPSLALFKARIGNQLTAPALFSAYQQWRQQGPGTAAASAAPQSVEQQHSLASDHERLQRIETKLDKILALLEQHNVSG